MKTTVKLGAGRALVIAPNPKGARIDLTMAGVVLGGDAITPDQAGALIFGLEEALRAAGHDVDAVRAQGGA